MDPSLTDVIHAQAAIGSWLPLLTNYPCWHSSKDEPQNRSILHILKNEEREKHRKCKFALQLCILWITKCSPMMLDENHECDGVASLHTFIYFGSIQLQ